MKLIPLNSISILQIDFYTVWVGKKIYTVVFLFAGSGLFYTLLFKKYILANFMYKKKVLVHLQIY